MDPIVLDLSRKPNDPPPVLREPAGCPRQHTDEWAPVPGMRLLWQVHQGHTLVIHDPIDKDTIEVALARIPWLMTILLVKAKRGEIVQMPPYETVPPDPVC